MLVNMRDDDETEEDEEELKRGRDEIEVDS